MRCSYCQKEIYRVISYNEFAYAISYCGKRNISTSSTIIRLKRNAFDPVDGRQMCITAPKGTITPTSHGVAAENTVRQ